MPENTKAKNKKVNKSQSSKSKAQSQTNDKFDFSSEMIIGLKDTSKNVKPTKKTDTKKKKKTAPKKTTKKTVRKKEEAYKEEKEPRKLNERSKKLLKVLVVILLLLGALVFFMLSPLFNITKIEVKGNNKLTASLIEDISGIIRGENTFKINTKEAINNIKQEAYISSVKISRNLPDTIVIDIVERQPTYMLEFLAGYMYINNQGYMIELSEEKLEIPILTGVKTASEDVAVGNRLVGEDLEKLEMVLKIMETAKNNGIADTITRIDITSKYNYKLILEGEGKTVYLGDCSRINTRIQYLKMIIEKEQGKNGEAFINGDMNQEKSVVFREEV